MTNSLKIQFIWNYEVEPYYWYLAHDTVTLQIYYFVYYGEGKTRHLRLSLTMLTNHLRKIKTHWKVE